MCWSQGRRTPSALIQAQSNSFSSPLHSSFWEEVLWINTSPQSLFWKSPQRQSTGSRADQNIPQLYIHWASLFLLKFPDELSGLWGIRIQASSCSETSVLWRCLPLLVSNNLQWFDRRSWKTPMKSWPLEFWHLSSHAFYGKFWFFDL